MTGLPKYKIIESFKISGRGTAVVIEEFVNVKAGKQIQVIVIRPDGTSFKAKAYQEWLLRRHSTLVEEVAFLLIDIEKDEVPANSLIELVDAEFSD
ncbi:MAG: hypothetical protein V4488_06735 [Pseudomonadota bacterium]